MLDSLISHKDSSIENIIALCRLDDQLAQKPGMAELQPEVGQLTVPAHGSGSGLMVIETPLFVSLDVARDRAIRIKGVVSTGEPVIGNIFTSLAKPFPTEYLFGTDAFPWDDSGTSSAVPISTVF